MLRNFQGGLKKILGGGGLRFFQEGLTIFHKGLGFFGKGLRFSSSVCDCFSDGYAIFGKGSFSGRLRFFREWFKFLEGVDAFGSVWDFFWEGLGLFPWC